MNSRGPRTEPCGTPLITFSGLEVSNSTQTIWLLPCKKEAIQFKISYSKPYAFNLRRSFVCDTVSNALLKSMYTESTRCLLLIASLHVCKVSISWVHVDRRDKSHIVLW